MEKSRIEVCLISKQAQRVPIPGLNIVAPFFEGERIHAEFMEKFRLPDILERLQTHSLAPVTIDVDEAMPYALILLRRKDGV